MKILKWIFYHNSFSFKTISFLLFSSFFLRFFLLLHYSCYMSLNVSFFPYNCNCTHFLTSSSSPRSLLLYLRCRFLSLSLPLSLCTCLCVSVCEDLVTKETKQQQQKKTKYQFYSNIHPFTFQVDVVEI